MKQNIFKYIAIAACLLGTTMTVQAQYHEEGGVKTAKNVVGPDENGFYTITLETFATGTTTVTESATPVDVVLVLDVSGSMNDNGKMTKLKTAVNTFIETIQENDLYIVERDAQGNVTKRTRRVDENNNPISLGNQISIVKFAEPTYYSSESGWVLGRTTTASITPGNHFPAYTEYDNEYYYRDYNTNYNAQAYFPRPNSSWRYDDYTRYNATEVLQGFTTTASDSNVSSLQTAVNSMIAAGSTAADYGLNLARLLLAGPNVNPKANKVVVFFTDGSPTHSSNFSNTVANNAITYAKQIKDSGATIFSIGVFDSTPATNGNIWRYMNYVSSNYPNATNINTAGADGDSTKNFYQDASSTSADLTSIFVAIAQGIGGSTEEIGASTQVRDVVSNSFVIPQGTTADDVKVYTADALTETTWDTRKAFAATVTFADVDKDGKRVGIDEGAGEATNSAIIVEGFDFSKDDTSEGAGDGNWVGQRFNNNHSPKYFWAGKKLIIELKIKANGEATGGTGSATNASTSGVYVYNSETGEYTCINNYDIPHTTLSTTIKIKKTGLRSGESATFEIMKIRPKGWDETKTLEENIANIQYNIIGKPLPNSVEYTGPEEGSDLYKKRGWSSFSKVILTNKSNTNGQEVIKTLRGLDPYWIYMVLEDDWGWAYDMSGSNQTDSDGLITTSSVEVNPFLFHNDEKQNAVKHAEAVTINHFQGTETNSKEEHYKSSKTEFPTTH